MKFIAFALLACAACLELSAAEVKPINATVGQEFKIALESNPTTGYQWLLAKPLNESMVKQVGRVYERPNPRQAGAAGCEVLKFNALCEGRTEIHLKYARLFENGGGAARSTNFVVVISKQEAKAGK